MRASSQEFARAEWPASLKAIVFDIDGTLYRQSQLRRAMMGRLLNAYAGHPLRGWRTARVLRAYRHAQERLRSTAVEGDISREQITLTCQVTHVDRREVLDCVNRWMEQEPLQFLQQCLQPGLTEFLQACRQRGLRLGALSDYPADAKLDALGLSGQFDIVLCAQAPEVNVFKPNPRGLLLALERLGADGAEALYIGDRVDVDAPTAEAAGVRCAIVTCRADTTAGDTHIAVASYSQLHDVLWG
jgi:HAD superfamily hydrolase (TIGR01549 family)